MRQVMKFAAARQQEVKQQGAAALETSLGFDQRAILETNLDYITKSLGASTDPSIGRPTSRCNPTT